MAQLQITQIQITPKSYCYGQVDFKIKFYFNQSVANFRTTSAYWVYDRTKFSAPRNGSYDATRTQWEYTLNALAGNTSNFTFTLAAGAAFHDWNDTSADNFTPAYGATTFPWYATDPNAGEADALPGDTFYTEGGPSTTFTDYPEYLASGLLTPFNLNVVFSEAVYAWNPATELIIANATKSSGVLSQSSPTIWNFTITPTGVEPVQLFVPSRSAVSVETAKYNNCSEQLYLSTRPAPEPVMTVPARRDDYGTPNQSFTISIDFGMVVYGFSTNDLTVTNGSAIVTGGTSGIFTATVTPSGSSPITYFIASGVCSNEAGKNNLASATYETIYTYQSAPGIGGGGGAGIGGVIPSGAWGSNPGDGTMVATSSGEFTASYLSAFTQNGTVVQLVHFPGIASTASGTESGGEIPPLPLGWTAATIGSGYLAGSGYYPVNYGSGVPYLSYAFLDFTQQNLDTSYSVKKSLNKNQAFAMDVDKGKIYLPPNIFLTLSESEVHVTSDGNQWAKAYDLVIRDVWVLLYNDFMWHLTMPKPRYIGADLCYIESDIQKIGLGYDPFPMIYQRGYAHPIHVASGIIRGHAVGGKVWPIDGGLY